VPFRDPNQARTYGIDCRGSKGRRFRRAVERLMPVPEAWRKVWEAGLAEYATAIPSCVRALREGDAAAAGATFCKICRKGDPVANRTTTRTAEKVLAQNIK